MYIIHTRGGVCRGCPDSALRATRAARGPVLVSRVVLKPKPVAGRRTQESGAGKSRADKTPSRRGYFWLDQKLHKNNPKLPQAIMESSQKNDSGEGVKNMLVVILDCFSIISKWFRLSIAHGLFELRSSSPKVQRPHIFFLRSHSGNIGSLEFRSSCVSQKVDARRIAKIM